ncbi:MAG: LEA type 2 family protein [Balneolaceae bacterium]|nr:LEA type 2 family protein [Balneolaceae bacterium]
MRIKIFISIIGLFLISGCAALSEFSDASKPDVEFREMNISNITFDDVTLLFDFNVNNPNRFAISAAGYEYDFQINDRSFVSGTRNEDIRIEQNSTGVFQVPVTLRYEDVYQTFRSLSQQDQIAYGLSTEVNFDLPVLGMQSIPVSTSGEIPVPKPPRIEFGDFNVTRVSLSGADAEVTFRVDNPNTFALSLLSASYNLRVNGREWLDTVLNESIRVESGQSREVRVPIRLNSAQLGSALMDLMGGNTTFDYELSGTATVSADLEGFPASQNIPFDLNGTYTVE